MVQETSSQLTVAQAQPGDKISCNLVICGGGNGAHVLAVLGRVNTGCKVSLYTIEDEVAKIKAAKETSGDIVVQGYKSQEGTTVDLKGSPHLVTSNPQECIPDADIIILCLPAFVHRSIFKTIAPLLKPGVTLVGMPGQAGFEFEARSHLGDAIYQKTSIINLASLPWACRLLEYGQRVDVIGTKLTLDGAKLIRKETTDLKVDPVGSLQGVLGGWPVLDCDHDLLYLTVMNLNAVVHPSVLYGQWASTSDVTPLTEAPLFYHGISQDTAQDMMSVGEEARQVGAACGVHEIKDMLSVYRALYKDQIEDDSSLYTAIRTNKAYRGLRHPMTTSENGQLVPNFQYRYLSEDLPNGLCVIKGIACLVGVKTPVIDRILIWSQEKLGKVYMVEGQFTGPDIEQTRAPQRFGFNSLDQILNCCT